MYNMDLLWEKIKHRIQLGIIHSLVLELVAHELAITS